MARICPAVSSTEGIGPFPGETNWWRSPLSAMAINARLWAASSAYTNTRDSAPVGACAMGETAAEPVNKTPARSAVKKM